jgi:hypothetical protein
MLDRALAARPTRLDYRQGRARAVARGAPAPVLSRALLAEVFEVGVAGETIPPTPWRAIERASSDVQQAWARCVA